MTVNVMVISLSADARNNSGDDYLHHIIDRDSCVLFSIHNIRQYKNAFEMEEKY